MKEFQPGGGELRDPPACDLRPQARHVLEELRGEGLRTVVLLVSLALVGNISLTKGVIGHEGSTVVVVMNSLRVLFVTRAALSTGGRAKSNFLCAAFGL